jgi:hypothetical protein
MRCIAVLTGLLLLTPTVTLFTGCAATPDEVRQQCLAHDVPHPMSAGQVAGTVAGAVLTLGMSAPIQKAVNEGRTTADCSEILGDETLKDSCPAYVTYCEQYFAERRNAAGATKVAITNNAVNAMPATQQPVHTNCVGTGYGINCVSR